MIEADHRVMGEEAVQKRIKELVSLSFLFERHLIDPVTEKYRDTS